MRRRSVRTLKPVRSAAWDRVSNWRRVLVVVVMSASFITITKHSRGLPRTHMAKLSVRAPDGAQPTNRRACCEAIQTALPYVPLCPRMRIVAILPRWLSSGTAKPRPGYTLPQCIARSRCPSGADCRGGPAGDSDVDAQVRDLMDQAVALGAAQTDDQTLAINLHRAEGEVADLSLSCLRPTGFAVRPTPIDGPPVRVVAPDRCVGRGSTGGLAILTPPAQME